MLLFVVFVLWCAFLCLAGIKVAPVLVPDNGISGVVRGASTRIDQRSVLGNGLFCQPRACVTVPRWVGTLRDGRECIIRGDLELCTPGTLRRAGAVWASAIKTRKAPLHTIYAVVYGETIYVVE